MSYFTDETHCKIHYSHYIQKSFGGNALVFTEEWRKKFLPVEGAKSGMCDGFNVLLKDKTDGATYKTKLYVAYDDSCNESIFDEDYNTIEITLQSVMGYFYGSHYCPCHRKQDAKGAGAIVENDECEGDRFLIESITCPDLPNLILYSETISEELFCMYRV
jgi:hypothetical protein